MRSSAKNLGVVDLVSQNHSKETGVGGRRKKRTLKKIPKFCLSHRKKTRPAFFSTKKIHRHDNQGRLYAML